MSFSGRGGFGNDCREAAVNESGDIVEGEKSTGEKEAKLNGVGPDDCFDATDVGIDEGENDEENDCGQDANAEHELDGNARDVNADARGERFHDEKENAGGAARARAEGIFEELVGRINFAFE